MQFDDVKYWGELTELMEWSKRNVFSTLHICWGAQAGLYHHYGVPKYAMERKLSGVYRHTVNVENLPLLRGFDDVFYMPHSRYTEVRREDIEKVPGLEIVAESDEAGVAIVMLRGGRQVFVTGHGEYDPTTLGDEYRRDLKKGLTDVDPPVRYFQGGDPKGRPVVRWRAHASLLFSNWLNYYVYQETPYDLMKIERWE